MTWLGSTSTSRTPAINGAAVLRSKVEESCTFRARRRDLRATQPTTVSIYAAAIGLTARSRDTERANVLPFCRSRARHNQDQLTVTVTPPTITPSRSASGSSGQPRGGDRPPSTELQDRRGRERMTVSFPVVRVLTFCRLRGDRVKCLAGGKIERLGLMPLCCARSNYKLAATKSWRSGC